MNDKPKLIQYNGDSKIHKALVAIANWLLANFDFVLITTSDIDDMFAAVFGNEEQEESEDAEN